MNIQDVKDHILSVEGVFDKGECDEIIKYYETQKIIRSRTSEDNWRTSEYSSLFSGGWESIYDKLIEPRLKELSKLFSEYTSKEKYYQGYICKEAHFLRYEPGDKCDAHVDGVSVKEDDKAKYGSMANCLIYLTQGAGAGDGALKFPEHDCSIEAIPGNAVMFPTSYTHPHEVEPVTKRRDVLACWLYAKAG